MSGYDQGSILTPMPSVTGSAAALAGPFVIKPSEAYSSALVTISGLTGETISVETSPDGYWGAPASPTFFRNDWQGNQQLYSTARTNLCLQSQDITTTWTTSTGGTGSLPALTANYSTAPDGTATADRVAMALNGGTAESDQSYLSQTYAGFTSGTLYYFSFWAKTNDASTKIVGINIFNSQVTTANITGAWTRFSGYVTPWFTASSSFGLRLRGGQGTSDSADLSLWGLQLEVVQVTPYIPTTTVAVTITDYTLSSNGVITFATAPLAGAVLSFTTPYTVFGTGDGTRKAWSFEGMWGGLTANSTKGNGIFQIDLRGAQAFRLTKSAGVETATVNMTLKRDALQYKNTAGTWTVT